MRRFVGALIAVTLCMSIFAGVAVAADPVGIIGIGDQATVRCFTHEQVHVYVTAEVRDGGVAILPGLGAVPMAGRGQQMVRDELATRYGRIYDGCTVTLTIVPLVVEEDVTGMDELPADVPRPPGEVTLPAMDLELQVGDDILVRCWTGDELHLRTQTPVAADGAIRLPDVPRIAAEGLTISELQSKIAAACQVKWPGASVDVRVVGEAAPAAEGSDGLVAPIVALTAAERFAALPRFGMDIFAAQERPAGADGGEALPAATLGEAVPSTYVVGPGDELDVRVWTDAIEHVNMQPVVDADGRVYLPLLGEVTVAGQQLAQVRTDLTQRYAKFFNRTSVSVGMGRTRVIEVRVAGDAVRPGKHPLGGAPTVFSALYAAGGPSEIGSLRAVKVIRGGQEPALVDLYDYLLRGEVAGDLPLGSGDTVFITPVKGMVGVAGQVRRPARYELTEQTTLTDALELAAGMTATGYAQSVQVWRVGADGQRQVLTVDATQAGPEGSGLPLADGDLIAVQPALETPFNIVELSGAVQRPGAYQVTAGMTVSDLIASAQGLTEFAHTEQAALWRMNDELDYEVTRFDLAAAMRGEAASNLTLAGRDRVIVYAEGNVERPSEVQVEGAVRFPSLLPWTLGMCVSDAVLQSGGLADTAYTVRAQIMRVGPDQRRAMLTVELAKALGGDAEANLQLERGDVLRIFTRSEVAPESVIAVGGFVREPGDYPRLQGMRVSDAILLAGGLDASAGTEVEYAQFGDTNDVRPVYLTLSRVGDDFRVEPDPVLTDNDHVAVLGVGENIAAPRVVTIKGFVDRPGTYALRGGLNDTETVYNLIAQAGGLLDNANPNGIVLYRLREEIIANEQEADLRQVINHFNRELASDSIGGQTQRMSGVAGTVTAGLTAALSEGGSAVVVSPRRLSSTSWAQAIPIDGGRLVATSGREGDFALINGDVVIVPTMPTTVTVLGAVIRPGALAFVEGQRAMDFINQAGGPAPDGKPGRLVIIRANGSVAPNAARAEIMPGDVLLVPSDYLIKHIDKPDTLDRILGAVGAALTGYLIFR